MFTDGKINIVEIKQYFQNILQIFMWKCEGPRIAKTVFKIIEKNCKTHMESPGTSYYIYHESNFWQKYQDHFNEKNILSKRYIAEANRYPNSF